MLVFEEVVAWGGGGGGEGGRNWSTQRKTSRSKGENQQQTQPTYGVDAGIRTQATLVRLSLQAWVSCGRIETPKTGD